MTIGTIAVDIFFITSGFLVTTSLLTRQSTLQFIWARVLRIFPALLVMLFLTVFGLGTYFTSLPLRSYLTAPETYRYLLKCSTLINGVSYTLPGVFHDNPYKYSVNGSLWSMYYEMQMYCILTVIWVALRAMYKDRLEIFKLSIVVCAAAAGVLLIIRHFFYLPVETTFVRLFFMFFSGAAFYILKEYVTLSHSLFLLLIIAMLLSVIASKHAFFIVYTLTITYVLFYIAYIPSGLIRHYNSVGDYSYGIYIYAFPIQQSIAALIPGVSVFAMLLISPLVAICFGAVSWHLLERRALGLKQIFSSGPAHIKLKS